MNSTGGFTHALVSPRGRDERLQIDPSFLAGTAMTTEGMKMLDAYLDAAKTARHLAHEYRRMALEYPKHAAEELAESARAFNRARYYLWQVRMWRAEQ